MSNIIEFANRLRDQIDIVHVIEGYLPLRRSGINLKGLCPFHREKTPSFTVNTSKQMFRCYGCGEFGDVIKFVQKVERVEWMDALRMLCDRYKIAMPEMRGGTRTPGQDELREKLHQVNHTAVDYFMKTLAKAMADPACETAQYCQRRGLDADTVKRFQIGLAPDSWTAFHDFARSAGFERDTLVTAGFVIHNQESNRFYDRFRRRLIFTICDNLARPIAFGARVFHAGAAPEEPKYVNSPETPLYRKGQQLYALHLARETIAREGRALIMEGYMDVIRAHQHGFTNAVATCGTSLTDEQARGLRKLCGEVVFAYDGDEAGQKAMLRGSEILLEHDLKVRIIALPANHDPDSFLAAEGPDAFRALVDEAADLIDYFLRVSIARFDRRTVEGKVQIVEALLPLLRKVANAVARSEYIRHTALLAGVDEASVLRRLRDLDERASGRLREQVAASAPTNMGGEGAPRERYLLKLAVEMPELRPLLNQVDPEWLTDPCVRRWFTTLCPPENDPNGPALSWNSIIDSCKDETDAQILSTIALDENYPISDCTEELKNILARLQHRHERRKRDELSRLVGEYELMPRPDGEDDPSSNLRKQMDDTRTNMRDLGHLYHATAPTPSLLRKPRR